jgi:hypothetical protein
VICSGGQRDGARGVRRIRANGGRVIVQDPRSAVQPSMPLAAVAAANLVLPIEALGRGVAFELAGLALDSFDREWQEPFSGRHDDDDALVGEAGDGPAEGAPGANTPSYVVKQRVRNRNDGERQE